MALAVRVLARRLGAATVEARAALAVLAAENLPAVLTGRRPPRAVNPDVLRERGERMAGDDGAV